MHPKYHNSYYWEKLIQSRKLMETFNNERITEQSVFFHGIIYNSSGRRKLLEGVLKDGYYLEPTILFGQNNMRVFQEEIFGPVLAVTTFKTMEEALELANDTQYGLGAGVWSRNGNLAYKMGRGIQAGRVWTNCYHAYPAHAAFGGYKQSGIGRETHKMMLEHYQQTKCLLVSYSDKPLGLF